LSDPTPEVKPSPSLEIPRDLYDEMVAHCLREAPLECCGLLGGFGSRVSSLYVMRNAAASESRYYADERDLIAVHIALRQRGEDILAIYHSHPRWEAVPSKTDLRENYYGVVPRIIVSLLEEAPIVRTWRLDEDSFEELPWRIVEADRPRSGPADASLEVAITPEPDYTTSRTSINTNPERSLSSMQSTLIIFKPDCVQRRLVGAILRRFEAKGLRVAALKLMQVDRALGEKHYAEHQGKPFFEGLIGFITGGPVVVGVLEGPEAIAVVRTMLGATNGVVAAPGTIRGDFSISKQNNLIHGSDSPESAQREIALWFRPGEAVSYRIDGEDWVSGGA
jgi:nucleoside-diphosphate kinase